MEIAAIFILDCNTNQNKWNEQGGQGGLSCEAGQAGSEEKLTPEQSSLRMWVGGCTATGARQEVEVAQPR